MARAVVFYLTETCIVCTNIYLCMVNSGMCKYSRSEETALFLSAARYIKKKHVRCKQCGRKSKWKMNNTL